jgi:hypothetical protein
MPGNVPPELGFEFLMNEVDLGLTFANIALAAAPNETDKIARSKRHAQEACDTILRYYGSVELDSVTRAKLDAGLRKLRNALRDF